eukprot:11177361-Lingulodinium_polyedra.AAC.1
MAETIPTSPISSLVATRAIFRAATPSSNSTAPASCGGRGGVANAGRTSPPPTWRSSSLLIRAGGQISQNLGVAQSSSA